MPGRFVLARMAARDAVVSRLVAAPVTVRLSVHPVLRFDYRPSLRVERERELRTRATPAAAAAIRGVAPPAQHHRMAPAAPTTPPERAAVSARPAVERLVIPRVLRRQRTVVDAVPRLTTPFGRTAPPVAQGADHGGPAPAMRRLHLPAPARLLPDLRDLRQRIEAVPASAPRQLVHGVRGVRGAAPTPTTTPAAVAAGATTATPSPAIPLPDVGHLTEQVIREIDRRILAHRERMGRGAF